MSQSPRARARLQTLDEILRIGRAQLAVHGAAGLSLRAVARDLGVVSSAVYRYVKSRDELLTLLVVDGYDALGDAVDAAVGAAPQDDFREQFRALARAVRTWAVAEPARYGLLFGSPVPGYEAPAERTTGPGTRVVGQLVRIVEGAHRAGMVIAEGPGAPPEDSVLSGDLAAIRAEWGLSMPEDVLARGVLVWAALFGAVNFEVFGQYGPSTFSDPAALFDVHLAALERMAGLR
ncbi:TetR/AcrR family transcriptional regulator [Specibacter sp. RAF43]|uniref:TetR/AcrR family transcriptional regulator n=1 Tax=Specibacter sp. RAF43 TaxID=3233057 RepID=UPI003F9CA09C